MKKIGLLLIVMLSGCTGFTPDSKFYTLQGVDRVEQTYKTANLVIGVGEVSVPQYLDRAQIVIRDDNQVELFISELHRWGEPLGDAIQLALVDDLALYLPSALVRPTSMRKENFDYIVWVEVNRFDGIWDKTANLSVWWNIYDKNKIVLREKTELQLPLKSSYDDLAIKNSELVSQLAAQIAEKIANLKK